jgi:hypothetical protein
LGGENLTEQRGNKRFFAKYFWWIVWDMYGLVKTPNLVRWHNPLFIVTKRPKK